MKTQTFQGSNAQLALREVRKHLGPDAVIMSTRDTDGGVEVVAGVMDADAEAGAPAPAAPAVTAHNAPATLAPSPRPRAAPSGVFPAGTSPAQALRALGLSADFRARVLAGLPHDVPDTPWSCALDTLDAHISVEDAGLLERGGRAAVLGGTGVGKTTTVVKLAAHFARVHGTGSVALVNNDNLRIGASEQLRRYASLMGLKVCDVNEPDELGAAFKRFAKCRLVLVDTAGTGHDRDRLLSQLQALTGAGSEVDCYLAMSLNTQTAVLERTARQFAAFPLKGCILTKSDEAASFGAGLSIAARHDLPINFVTTGPQVPSDILVPGPGWLIERALALLEDATWNEVQMREAYTAREVN